MKSSALVTPRTAVMHTHYQSNSKPTEISGKGLYYTTEFTLEWLMMM